jgi:hypothetical protein
MATPEYGLGRRYTPDRRDALYPMQALLPAMPTRTSRFWYSGGWWGNQGNRPECVAYSGVHMLNDGPVLQSPVPCVDPRVLYREAQELDEWPGNDYAGTSVRGGAKALVARGFIASYHWALRIEDVVLAVLEYGPVWVGTNWYRSMYAPNSRGYVTVEGALEGGHAYLINGVDLPTRAFRCKNSWGTRWASGGHFWISIYGGKGFERLLAEDGEAAIVQEIPRS